MYSECEYTGESTQSCSKELVDVNHDVKSARVPAGAALHIDVGMVHLNINNDIECLTSPLIIQNRKLRISVGTQWSSSIQKQTKQTYSIDFTQLLPNRVTPFQFILVMVLHYLLEVETFLRLRHLSEYLGGIHIVFSVDLTQQW